MNRDATATWMGTRTGPCDGLPAAPCGQALDDAFPVFHAPELKDLRA